MTIRNYTTISGLTGFIKEMESPKRTCQGLALVITNYACGKKIRNGADNDHKNMEKSFKHLGFDVICYKNVTKSKLTDLLDECSKKTDWNKYNSFALAISSHGLEIEKKENGKTVKHHAIRMFDDVTFDTKDVLGYFSDKECTGLIDKAKIFFIQACRIPESKSTTAHKSLGIGLDPGTDLDTTNIKDSSVEDQHEIDAPKPNIIYPPAHLEVTVVPCYNDMLIMFACPEDYYAFRNAQGGSHMLRLFSESVDAWHKKSDPTNLMEMLRDVTYNMSRMEFPYGLKKYKIVPNIVHKLKKDVIFNGGNIMYT
uniref:Caspase family p20 domain-containing protein n=1 Tax=Magallana gigas TaxID=29159 RepID=A0A8W8M567_MAGGI